MVGQILYSLYINQWRKPIQIEWDQIFMCRERVQWKPPFYQTNERSSRSSWSGALFRATTTLTRWLQGTLCKPTVLEVTVTGKINRRTSFEEDDVFYKVKSSDSNLIKILRKMNKRVVFMYMVIQLKCQTTQLKGSLKHVIEAARTMLEANMKAFKQTQIFAEALNVYLRSKNRSLCII